MGRAAGLRFCSPCRLQNILGDKFKPAEDEEARLAAETKAEEEVAAKKKAAKKEALAKKEVTLATFRSDEAVGTFQYAGHC